MIRLLICPAALALTGCVTPDQQATPLAHNAAIAIATLCLCGALALILRWKAEREAGVAETHQDQHAHSNAASRRENHG